MDAKQSRIDKLSHAISKRDRVNGRMVRVIHDDLGLLRDALSAARKGKNHVVIDHLERVIDSLSQFED